MKKKPPLPSFKSILLEMPQHYKGEVAYQKDSKFRPISVNNIKDRMLQLGVDDDANPFEGNIYAVSKHLVEGFIFNGDDFKTDKLDIVPIMHLSLRDSGVGNLKQAHNLRIRESYSGLNLVQSWYDYYIKYEGGIVSDREHLQGGKILWLKLIKMAERDPRMTATLFDLDTQETINNDVNSSTPDDEIWSNDASKKNHVIVLTYD
jgi:hypothetical protein